MKTVACLVLLVIINAASSDPLGGSRGCLYIQGRCLIMVVFLFPSLEIDGKGVRECEEGTKAYVVDCDYMTPEPTCDEPDPQPDFSGIICDYSQCYCEGSTVRDPITNKCVALEDCTKFE